MRRNTWTTFFGLLSVAIATTAIVGGPVQEKKQRRVTRVERPKFSERDWEGIYFKDLFAEGLVGDRPDKQAPSLQPKTGTPSAGSEKPENTTGFAWSQFISRESIENEVKTLQMRLARDITTPNKFKSQYLKARQSFSILSMLFAIIREYDDDVRWREYAPSAQVAFSRAAANARVGSQQAYQNARRRLVDLQEMVRGGTFNSDEKGPDKLEWPLVVDRSPMMQRLEKAIQETLKPATANKTEFNKAREKIVHEADVVAAIAQVLIREEMDEADDEGYAEYAKAMSRAAQQVAQAGRRQDYEAASMSVNLIEQACSNCHDEWR